MKGNLRRMLAIFLVLMLLSADICAIAEAVATLILPSALQIIEEEAFTDNTSIEKVIVPDGTTEIRSRAFADSSMTELVLPDSLTFIAEDAFEGCGEFALTVPENCYAYDRCVELGLIKSEEPDPSVIESAHPYPDEFDYTWTYDADEGTESVTITFSADTETEEDYDFIYIYTLDDVQVGKYSGTELAGQSVIIDGTGFKLRLTSDEVWGGANTYYGFKLDSIIQKKAEPLTFVSMVLDDISIHAGESTYARITTTGGKGKIYYDIESIKGGEVYNTHTYENEANVVQNISWKPYGVGEYQLSVVVRDENGTVLPKQYSDILTITPSVTYPQSAHPYAANTNKSWYYVADESVTSMNVYFSSNTKTESNADYVYIYDKDNVQIGKYSGTTMAGKYKNISGNAFKISLVSNGSVQYNGFQITEIVHFTESGYSFTLAEGGAMITGYSGSSKRLNIPEKIGGLPVVAIKSKAFQNRTDLTHVTFPDSLNVIGSYAFDGCKALNGVITFPANVVLGDYSFQNCSGIDDLKFNGRVEFELGVFRYCTGLTQLVLPAKGGYRFAGRSEATTAQFYGCTNIKKLVWSSFTSLGDANFDGVVTTNALHELKDCLEEVVFIRGELIAGEQFKNFTKLKKVTFAEDMRIISNGAFYGCTNLEIDLDLSNVGGIGDYAFYNCTKAKNLKLGRMLTSIGEYAFYNCDGITGELEIPGEDLIIGKEAFRACSYITKVKFSATSTSIRVGAFKNCNRLSEVIMNQGVNAYSRYQTIEGTANNIFAGCTSLKKLTLGSESFSTGDIREWMLYELKDILEEITFNEGVFNIGSRAFKGFTKLKAVHIPTTLDTISADAFDGCTALTTIYGKAGSYAETFANEGKYTFVAEEPVLAFDTLSGTVTDTLDNPLSGVTVTVYEGSGTSDIFATTTTDSNGKWSVSCAKVGRHYGVGFEKKGYSFAPEYVSISSVADGEVIHSVGSDVRNDFAVSHGHINGLTAGYAGGLGMNIVVASTGSWTIKSDSDWLASSISSGENGDNFYSIIEENPDFEARVGYFTLECEGHDPIIIRVTQEGKPRNAGMLINRPDETRITNDSVEITGRLIWGANETAEDYEFVGIQYGEKGKEWQETIGVKPAYTEKCSFDPQTGRFSAVITGLENGKIYRFQTVAQRTDGTWVISPEEVTARIVAYCEHDYAVTYYAYDASVKEYHDQYIAEGNLFLPETFVESSEALTKHEIRHPYIQICSKCNGYNVIYQNQKESHEWTSATVVEYRNINENTHDAYSFLVTSCSREVNGAVCGYVFSKDPGTSAVGQVHSYVNGVCACGYCNAVWKAEINKDKLHINVSVESGQPDGNKDYQFIAIDNAGIPHSAVIPKGTLSKTFAIKADLHLSRAQRYKFYVVPDGVDLNKANMDKYFVSDAVIPLYAGNMVTGVYSGDKAVEDRTLFYGDDVEIHWDGSYGVKNTTVKVWVNSNLVFNQTFNSDGPDTILVPYSDMEQYLSGGKSRSSEDKLIVNVTANPPADSGISPITSPWEGTFVKKPESGYRIYLSWNGLPEEECTFDGNANIGVDVTDQDYFHITAAGGGSEYFGMRAYLDGEPLLLTEDDCEYEWVFCSQEPEETIGGVTTVTYPVFNEKTKKFDPVWAFKYFNKGYTFQFNKDGNNFKRGIELKKKGDDEVLAWITVVVHDQETFAVTGKDAHYSKNEAGYSAEVLLPISQKEFWDSATKEQRRMLFDLNYKRPYINTLIPSSTVEVFIDACKDELGWDIRTGAVQLLLNIGDVVTGTFGDIAEYLVDLSKLVAYDSAMLVTGNFDKDTLKKSIKMLEEAADSVTTDNTIYKMVTDKSDFINEIVNSLNTIIKVEAAKVNNNTLSKTQADMMYGFFNALFSEGGEATKSFLYELFTDIADKGFDSLRWSEQNPGSVVVGFKYGSSVEYVTLKPEQLFNMDALENMTSGEAELFANMFLEKPSQDLLEKGEYRMLWKAMGDDWQKKAFDALPKDSRMRKALRPDVLYTKLNKYMDLADCLFAGYDAYRTMDLYDQALNQLETNMRPLIENYGKTNNVDMSEYDDKWVQELMDALTKNSASAVEEVLTAMVTKAVEKGLQKLTAQAAREIMADVAGRVVAKFAEGASTKAIGVASAAASYACAAWTGVEVGLFLTNASNTVGKMPEFKELYAMYQSTQNSLYDAMDTYVEKPSKENYQKVEQLAYMYNILKGACITTQYSIFINDAQSLRARYANYAVWSMSVYSAFLQAIRSGDWDVFTNAFAATDARKNRIHQYEDAMAGELEQMKDLIEILLPKL